MIINETREKYEFTKINLFTRDIKQTLRYVSEVFVPENKL